LINYEIIFNDNFLVISVNESYHPAIFTLKIEFRLDQVQDISKADDAIF
jgi:hypothetical protein